MLKSGEGDIMLNNFYPEDLDNLDCKHDELAIENGNYLALLRMINVRKCMLQTRPLQLLTQLANSYLDKLIMQV